MTCATPLSWDGTVRISELIWVRCEGKYFCKRGWTSHFGKHEVICPPGKISNEARTSFRCMRLPPARNLSDPPTHLLRDALVELGLIGAFRRLPHPLVEPVGVVADQNAPALGLDAIEDDPGGLGGGHRRILKEAAGAFGHRCPNVLVRHL